MGHDNRNPGVVIKLRRDTTTNWATDNPVLEEGETGWDTDLRRVKLGDGVTAWNDLPWAADEAADVDAETARAEAAEAGLDTRVDSLEASRSTYGDIVTHDVSEFTTDAEVATLVAAELAAYEPGLEIGYSERTTSFTSTQTAPNATGTITGLVVVVTGAGRPVDVRFSAPLAWQSTANKLVFTSLMVNGGASGGASADSSPLTNNGPSHTFTRRMVLTDGVVYTFTVAVYTESGGGTATMFANATYPMSLSVTNR